MNPETLRKIFKSSFDYTTYSNEIVHRLFNCNDVATNPELLDTNAEGDKSYFIGQMEDTDGRLLGFFYTRVADGGDVRRKRVGLRKLIQPYLKYDVDGAIAVFDDGNHWRLSYICDLKEGSTSAKRFSYILGEEQGQYKTPIERLGKVAEKNGRFKLSDLREAFSVDALSKEFFDEYHRHYDIIINELKGQGFEGATIHDYVKKMMGRIVFLHFLQKKGWLNGNLAFLRDLFFFSPHQEDFLEKVLEPLFFGIFNTEPQNREKVFLENDWDLSLLKEWNGGSTNALTHSHIDALPYLNGGLFERDAVDEQNITLPASLFEDLFTFMASYNFTVDENDPDDAEVGVDPEMLGKIFESLLEDNKAKGAFYTPKEIVRYMCKESLIAYLATQIDKSQSEGKEKSDSSDCDKYIRAFVETHEMQPELEPYREALDTALREVKICDPAIGSGAFPMGLLNELWRCREALSQSERKEPKENSDSSFSSDCNKENSDCAISRVELKKEIIENNIYGVDIEKGAIDIARLRFWLSIVVDAEEPEPLPNFDYKFMQGNSLIESFEGFDLSRISSRLRGGQSKSMQLVLGIDSHTSRQNLQRLLREYFSVTDHKKKSSMRQAINEEVKTLIRESIGGTPASLAKLEKMDCSANQDFFLWHTWFKDIFDNGGFDIVIGNPPYFKYEGKNKNEIDSIRKSQYLEIAFGGKLNAYKLFLALSINKICKSNGIISLIFQNSFIADKQASILRREVINKHQIITIDSFPERDSKKKRVFENVKMSVCILLMQKSVTGKRFNVNFWNDKYKSSGTNIKFSADEIKRIDNEDYCIPRIEQKTIPLVIKLRQMNKFPLKCYEGELNMTFHKSFFNSNPNNPTILKGAAIQRYYITYRMSQGEIEYLDEKRFLTENSSEKAFHHEQERLAMQGMTGANDKIRLVMTIVPRGVYLANSCNYIIPTKELPAKYLLGLMNSHLMNWYFRCFSTNSNVNGYEVENFPMPSDNTDIRRKITELVDDILNLKAINASEDTSRQEQQIDKLVYKLYNLTPEEIAVIEQ